MVELNSFVDDVTAVSSSRDRNTLKSGFFEGAGLQPVVYLCSSVGVRVYVIIEFVFKR